jgi:hypothetical protein
VPLCTLTVVDDDNFTNFFSTSAHAVLCGLAEREALKCLKFERAGVKNMEEMDDNIVLRCETELGRHQAIEPTEPISWPWLEHMEYQGIGLWFDVFFSHLPKLRSMHADFVEEYIAPQRVDTPCLQSVRVGAHHCDFVMNMFAAPDLEQVRLIGDKFATTTILKPSVRLVVVDNTHTCLHEMQDFFENTTSVRTWIILARSFDEALLPYPLRLEVHDGVRRISHLTPAEAEFHNLKK